MAATNADATKGVLMLYLHIEAVELTTACIALGNVLADQGRESEVRRIVNEALLGDPKDWK